MTYINKTCRGVIFTCLLGCSSPDPDMSNNPIDGGDTLGGDTLNDTDTSNVQTCDPSSIQRISAKTSSAISTVGIVEWSTTMNPIQDAFIEFGLDTQYGNTAPVNLNTPNYRTLLLGMKPSQRYHYRIVVNGCAGVDQTIETGAPPSDLPEKQITIRNESLSAEGFIVSSTGMKSHYVYVLDKDGDYVWWFPFQPDKDRDRMDGIARAKMSADGTAMWAGTINMACGCGYLFRINMDGLGAQETIPVDRHHDFTVLPDNTVAYIEYTDDGDRIVERYDNGETRTVYNLRDDFDGSGIDWSHCNAIHYYPSDDTYTVSCLNLDNIIKIDRASGTLVWNLEGNQAGDFSGVSWKGQHGHQLLGNGNLLFFTNSGVTGNDVDLTNGGSPFVNQRSEALELSLNIDDGLVTEIWRYVGGPHSGALGDVQRIAGGNTMVVYSTAGIIHEVSASKKLIRIISVDGLGYADWRPSLYGEPYRY